VEITVSDTGPGIPQHLRTKLFTPFVSSKPSGTGLGLALAHKIISLHGGTIAFEPDCGRGAVCRVVLPLIAEEMQFPVTPTSSIAK
jgi:signal transduction histidine kinase